MGTDKTIRDMFTVVKNIKWNEEEGFQWYYAEDNHYIVSEKKTGALWLIKAKSPIKAIECVKGKTNDN